MTTLDNTSAIVARQYSDYCYPKPVPDMKEAIKNGFYEYGSPALVGPIYWPEGKSLSRLRVLIAGCGTNQAAYNALTLPEAQITAIDLSDTSLGHTQYLKEKHSLNNLTLHRLNLLDVGSLNQQYDLIISTGVLHHLPDPDAGLRALRDVLVPDGIMCLMVYGRYLRAGVYMLQQVFKLLGCQNQTPEDLALVKATLASLDPNHFAQQYIKAADDLKYDSGLVDTFLHQQDRAYSVLDVLSFANANGLAFWDWLDRLDYSVSACIPPSHPIHTRLQTLNPVAQWAVVELLTQARGTHRFLFAHPQHTATARKIRFDHVDWQAWIPSLRQPIQVLERSDHEKSKPAKLKRSWHEFYVSNEMEPLIEGVDGKQTIRAIIQSAQTRCSQLTIESARAFFAQMHDWGHLLYSLNASQQVSS